MPFRQFLTTLAFLTCLTNSAFSQELTGIWRGAFYNIREVLMGGSRYRYEVQINNEGKGVKGVTYSYQTTRFYGKASLVGVWTPETNNLIMKEEVMQDLKIEGGGDGCLMTCYLDYHKEGEREFLEGTYTSRNMKNGSDCGGGKVFLEKVPDSDFEKEDFLKKKDEGKVKPGQEDFLVKKPGTKPPVKKAPPTTAKPTPKPTPPPVVTETPPATPPPATEEQKTVIAPPTEQKPETKKPDTTATAIEKPQPPKQVPTPPVLKERKNELFQTIVTSAKTITVSFYDNGDIDGDTISVYDNNRLVVQSKGLSANAIDVKVALDESIPVHDIIMVAENLGSIPPNTALMIVEAGTKRYTVFLSSNEQKNAMVRIKFDPAEP